MAGPLAAKASLLVQTSCPTPVRSPPMVRLPLCTSYIAHLALYIAARLKAWLLWEQRQGSGKAAGLRPTITLPFASCAYASASSCASSSTAIVKRVRGLGVPRVPHIRNDEAGPSRPAKHPTPFRRRHPHENLPHTSYLGTHCK